jgi:DNA-binding protein YbaB
MQKGMTEMQKELSQMQIELSENQIAFNALEKGINYKLIGNRELEKETKFIPKAINELQIGKE